MKLVKIKIYLYHFIFSLFVLVELRNELTKEQDSRQKLEKDILELRRVRSI